MKGERKMMNDRKRRSGREERTKGMKRTMEDEVRQDIDIALFPFP
jgi:hypothetical protein